MFRQSPRNNGRNKGVKVKHVVQISLLLGVSIWLLYQVHHSDDKKVSVTTNNVSKLRNDTLGRKGLRPKVKETDNVNDGKEAEEREPDEKEDEEVGHETESEEREDMEHKELGENEHVDDHDESEENEDGDVKTTKKGNERIKNENFQIEREGKNREDRGSKKEATKEEKANEKSGEQEQGNKGNKKENKKFNVSKEGKKKYEGGKKEMKVHKSDKKEHKESDGAEEIKGKMNKDKSNEQNKVAVVQKGETMGPHPKEVEISSSSEDHEQSVRDEIENVEKENESVEDITIPDSYSAPSFESETTSSMNADSDIEGQDKEQSSNDDVSVLEEEKDALTDLGTLPEAETGGSISHDNAATE